MTFGRALQLFLRRTLCLEPAKLCPLPGLRRRLYRWMGVRVGRDVFIGFGVEMDTNHPELIEIGDHVTVSHRCIIASHMATDVATPLQKLYPPQAAPVKICAGAHSL